MLRYLTIRKFAAESGYSEIAIRSKIHSGIWMLDQVWKKAPDGRVLIDVEGYHKWVEGEYDVLKVQLKRPAKSRLKPLLPDTDPRRSRSPAPLVE